MAFANQGHFEVRKLCGNVLAAPHGQFDYRTEHITALVAFRLKWSYVIARGFRTFRKPINVNRPTEGVRLAAGEEKHTHDAMLVFRQYESHVRELNPQFYVEIHGATLIQNRIEIALNGVSPTIAAKIRGIFQAEVNQLDLNVTVAIDGLDNIHYTAMGAKQWGMLGQLAPGLHIELPPQLRDVDIRPTVELLTRALPQVLALTTR